MPNGGFRNPKTAGDIKDEGVVAGVSDLILLVKNKRYGALLIEMKAPGKYQRPVQKQWEKIVTAKGEYKYVVCRSLDEFIKVITEYLNDQ